MRISTSAIGLLLACKDPAAEGQKEEADEPVEASDLPLPDISGLDFVAAYEEALVIALGIHAGVAWQGHQNSLRWRQEGCPDFYAGAPDNEFADIDEETGGSWSDYCTFATDLSYRGYVWWDSSLGVAGDATTPEGATVEGSRSLVGDGIVVDGAEVLYEFDGEASDSVYRVDAPEYLRWTWSSLVQATVTGLDAFDPATAPLPEGWRADLYLAATGGDVEQVEIRGNGYFFSPVIAGRFDSVAMDLALLGPGALGPEDCALEPRGWIGLRDEDAYWYELVFSPLATDDATGGDTATEAYTDCDGCGTLYIRGTEVTEVGTVCPDMEAARQSAALSPPEATDYVLPLHSLEAE